MKSRRRRRRKYSKHGEEIKQLLMCDNADFGRTTAILKIRFSFVFGDELAEFVVVYTSSCSCGILEIVNAKFIYPVN